MCLFGDVPKWSYRDALEMRLSSNRHESSNLSDSAMQYVKRTFRFTIFFILSRFSLFQCTRISYEGVRYRSAPNLSDSAKQNTKRTFLLCSFFYFANRIEFDIMYLWKFSSLFYTHYLLGFTMFLRNNQQKKVMNM